MIYLKYLKRPIDIFVSIAVFIFAIPIIAVVVLLIKIFDRGPVIFSQKRVGLHGVTFVLFKFRTMPVNTGDIASDKLGKVKIGRIGKFLRRSNLDELPQLMNIILGDMSIIGPRPQLPSQTDLYELREKSGVFEMRPGLTGWAQVNSFDGMDIYQKVEFDHYYIRKMGFAFDALILLRTVSYIFRPPPVY